MVDNHQRAVHHRDALKLSERHARGRCMSSVDVAVVNVTLVDVAHELSEPHAGGHLHKLGERRAGERYTGDG